MNWKLESFRVIFEELKNNNIQEIIKNLYLPITIIHGTEDDMAPINDSIEFQNKFNFYSRKDEFWRICWFINSKSKLLWFN